ncbi:MAG: lysophospholipid acyltransferase family protein [Candidatus Margulisbacteria bacterium]|nr:lysophospholipid acyltransferase family protein [Candidatus Margulisiibacteriota bacterium]
MLAIKILVSLFFWIYLQVFILLVFLLSYPLALLPQRGRSVVYFLVKWILRLLFFVCFIRIKVLGKGTIPKSGQLIFICNHPALIEPLFIIAYLPVRVRFIADEPMLHFPLLGRVVRSLGAISYPLDSKDKQKAFVFAYEYAQAMKNNDPVLFFSANMRNKEDKGLPIDPKLLEFINKQNGVVIPVTIKNILKVAPADSMFIRPGKIEIVIGFTSR